MSDYRIFAVTVSDRCSTGEREDKSGPAIVEYIENSGLGKACLKLVPDDRKKISDLIVFLTDEEKADLVITTGGTGISPKDVTPEATIDVADRVIPGIAEAIRAYSLTKTKNAMLSRGVAAQRGRTLIINLPGSPGACRESMDVIIEALPHAIGIMKGEKLDS